MAIKSISDLYNFSLYIFDLDNTIYKEEDYLFEAYKNIAASIAWKIPSLNKEELFLTLRRLYETDGRILLFDNFLNKYGIDQRYLQECIHILRSFKAVKKYRIFPVVKKALRELVSQGKPVFILTNGNPEQQRNKIKNINWEGIERSMTFVFANEFEPKPSSAGVEYILNISGIERNKAVMIGDSEIDHNCAENSGLAFIDVKILSNTGN